MFGCNRRRRLITLPKTVVCEFGFTLPRALVAARKPPDQSGGNLQPASSTALPPELPLALRHEDRTGNLRLPLVPLGFLTCLIHLSEREFVGDKRVEGELVTVPYQIV